MTIGEDDWEGDWEVGGEFEVDDEVSGEEGTAFKIEKRIKSRFLSVNRAY